jgi:hypothetical protein
MELTIDGKQIRANAFVQKILTNISWSIIDSLDDIPENPQTIDMSCDMDSTIAISVDGQAIRMNPFVNKTTHNIIMGVINSLDKIPANPHNIALSISKK